MPATAVSADLSLWTMRTTIEQLGQVVVMCTNVGISNIALPDFADADLRMNEWEKRGYQSVKDMHPHLHAAEQALKQFIRGQAIPTSLAYDLSNETTFTQNVLRELLRVPCGKTVTYGELAQRANCPRGARAVGGAVGRNPIPVLIPCHRVVAAQHIGGFDLGLTCKRLLLRIEGHADVG
jgi:O-6-methylguanine DNA methyltransferase